MLFRRNSRIVHFRDSGWYPFISILLVILLLPSCNPSLEAEFQLSLANRTARLTLFGAVLDANSGRSLSNASINVFCNDKLVSAVHTDLSGSYNLSCAVEAPSFITIIAWLDYESTSGVDYIPSIYSFTIKEYLSHRVVRVDFKLHRSASIIFSGKVLHLNFTSPAHTVSFKVVDEKLEPFTFNGSVNTYGAFMKPQLKQLFKQLGLNESIVIVPAETPFNIEVRAYFKIEHLFSRKFKLSEIRFQVFPKHTTLRWGEAVRISLTKISLEHAIEYINELINRVSLEIDDFERANLYVEGLKIDVNRASMLLNDSIKLLSHGKYIISFNYLKRAKIILEDVIGFLNWIESEAVKSSIFLSAFSSISSIILSSLLIESFHLKLLLAVLFSHVIYLVLMAFYPLFMKVGLLQTYPPLISMLTLLLALSKVILNANSTANLSDLFSLAKRNLRRRKFRTMLLTTSVLIFTAAIIAFTSYTIEREIRLSEWDYAFNITGLGFENYEYKHAPIDLSILEALNLTGKVLGVTFRAEDIPRSRAAGCLMPARSDASGFWPVTNLISFSSPMDPVAKIFEQYLVSGYLPIGDDEVAVDLEVAKALNASIGDVVKLNYNGKLVNLTIAGIFNGKHLIGLSEVTGRPLLPYCVIAIVKGEGVTAELHVKYSAVHPSSIAIISWNIAETLNLKPTRAFIYMNCSLSELMRYAELIVLMRRDYVASAIYGGRACTFRFENVAKIRGLETLFLVLLVLMNSIISSINLIYERRRDVEILSAVGVAPSIMLGLFALEAVIIGLIGGILGFITGLGFYKILILNPVDLKPKISFTWTIASSFIGAVSVLIGALPILASNLLVIPSRKFRFEADEKPTALSHDWIFLLPVELRIDEAEMFINFMAGNIEECFRKTAYRAKVVSLKNNRLIFIYDTGFGALADHGRGIIELKIEDSKCTALLKVRVYSADPEKCAHEIARIVRFMALIFRAT